MTDKRIILVTGASRGIGRAAAILLARSGIHVIALARSKLALEELGEHPMSRDETPGIAVSLHLDVRVDTGHEVDDLGADPLELRVPHTWWDGERVVLTLGRATEHR